MSIEDKMEQFAARLDRRIAAHQKRQEMDRAELAALFRQAQQADEKQQARLERAASPAWSGPPPVEAQVALGQADILQRLDRLLWTTFELERLFPGHPLGRYPVVYCETLAEFFTPILAAEDCSESERQRLLGQWVAGAEEMAAQSGGGILGVNLPGRGCYLNGWLFGLAHGVEPGAALQEQRIFGYILATACHEKLGHGFIAELTAVGQEKSRLGLWRFDLARDFSLRAVDTPRGSLLRQKQALVHQSTQFTEEGWATWIEQYMLWQAAREGLLNAGQTPPQPAPRYTLEQAVEVLRQVHEQVAEARPLVEQLGAALHLLLIETEPQPPPLILAAVRFWQEAAGQLDGPFGQQLGQPAVYVLGYLLLRRLEARLGWQNLPAAVTIAANVDYDLEQTPLSDLAALVSGDHRLNVDARLALLGTLDLAPHYRRTDLVHQARERLSLAVPEGW